ncbi:hypothetical protein SS50377_22580 [Spironucleus salmonicida]|uniref:Uncharacterized protein n=1 Tax=Spironucleus salmonicida TaxID=348837 RepID=V6LCF4_9EUKA|nr:hypothetical protein SS50377_22580 [Spironucleus salmonicida]|eukprot:EST41928.1 Hypothetical protein SS50377_18232 [Spironucleus salmonicida]
MGSTATQQLPDIGIPLNERKQHHSQFVLKELYEQSIDAAKVKQFQTKLKQSASFNTSAVLPPQTITTVFSVTNLVMVKQNSIAGAQNQDLDEGNKFDYKKLVEADL